MNLAPALYSPSSSHTDGTYTSIPNLIEGLIDYKLELITAPAIRREISDTLYNAINRDPKPYDAIEKFVSVASGNGREQLRVVLRRFVEEKGDLEHLIKEDASVIPPGDYSPPPPPHVPDFFDYFLDADALASALSFKMQSMMMDRSIFRLVPGPRRVDFSTDTASTATEFIKYMMAVGDVTLYEAVEAYCRGPKGKLPQMLVRNETAAAKST